MQPLGFYLTTVDRSLDVRYCPGAGSKRHNSSVGGSVLFEKDSINPRDCLHKEGRTEASQEEKMLAERTGLEPATTGVTGQYSNQLNYRSEIT